MGVFEELVQRGFVNQITDPELGKILAQEPMVFYAGFDPTADSLHIGNLLAIMGMVHLQKAGHKPIGVVGGGTGLIGDPSGKSHERQLLSREQIEKNMKGIKAQLEHYLQFGKGSAEPIILNNLDWLGELNLIDFLRDIGKHFRLSEMLNRESVRLRMQTEEGISFTEFCYQLLQAYDFFYLCHKYNCRLQVGGSDQWGNITAGIDLIRSQLQKQAYGLTFPLMTTATGAKFGKTEQGAIWLDPFKTSPYQFYQYWIQTDDRDVIKYLKIFTLLPLSEIDELSELVKNEPEKREAQRRLAFETTAMAHGRASAEQAEKASRLLFSEKLENLSDAELLMVFDQAPKYELSRSELEKGIALVDLLASSGALASKSEARRKIKEGGVYLNNQRIPDQEYQLGLKDLASENFLVLRTGKRNYFLVRIK